MRNELKMLEIMRTTWTFYQKSFSLLTFDKQILFDAASRHFHVETDYLLCAICEEASAKTTNTYLKRQSKVESYFAEGCAIETIF